MFVRNEKGKAVKIRSIEDVQRINKTQLDLLDENGKTLMKKVSKNTLIDKLF